MTKDDFHYARLVATNEWTPAHGSDKRRARRKARAFLRRLTRKLREIFWEKF